MSNEAKSKSEHHVKAGQKGGAARTDAKRKSSSANLIIARAKRYQGRVLAAQATLDARAAHAALAAQGPVIDIPLSPADESQMVDEFLKVANSFAAAHNSNPNRVLFTPAESDEPYPLDTEDDSNG